MTTSTTNLDMPWSKTPMRIINFLCAFKKGVT